VYKILYGDKDTYITDRVVRGVRTTGSNVGAAGTLDLFKLYGVSYTVSGTTRVPNVELSRILLHFDLDPLRDLIASSSLDPENQSFSCTLRLFDVYGGQPTPSNFTVVVHPLSQTFDEGFGKDVVFYSDRMSSNFTTASYDSIVGNILWNSSGANTPGYAGQPSVDYVTGSSRGVLECKQTFVIGEEDAQIDVTNIIRSVVVDSSVPDCGLRVAYSASHENDTKTYFVKRFASKDAYDKTKQPQLVVKYDDSYISDQTNLRIDTTGSIPLYNFRNGVLSNLITGSSQLTGSNCVNLNLRTEISGGWANYVFSGSWSSTGFYTASVFFGSTDSVIMNKMIESGSVVFDQIWTSIGNAVTFMTGSDLTLNPADRGNDPSTFTKYSISVLGLQPEHTTDESLRLRVNIYDVQKQYTKLVKSPISSPSLVIHDVHYSVRDYMSDVIIIPYDTVTNSTRLSADSKGMYLDLDLSNLLQGTYVIDLMIKQGSNEQVYRSASPVFRVVEPISS
jgi:hypothetical protein